MAGLPDVPITRLSNYTPERSSYYSNPRCNRNASTFTCSADFIRRGFAPAPEMLAAGVNVALGSDGYANNFFEEMRAAALMPKARLLDPARCPPTCPPPLTSHNLAEQLLLWRNPQHLRDVMCAGRWLLSEG